MIKRILIILVVILLNACNGNTGETKQDSDALPVVREQYVAKCHLSGNNIAKEYPKVLVYRADQVAFMHKEKPVASFPIKNGSFDGIAMMDTTLVYEMVFTVPNSGMFMMRPFVPTVLGVSIIGPDSMDSDEIALLSDSPENECMKGYEAIFQQLMPQAAPIYEEYSRLASEKTLYNEKVNAMLAEAETASRERSLEIYNEFRKIQDLDESYSEEGLAVKRRIDAFRALSDSLSFAHVANHPSLSSFYRIYSIIQNAGDNTAITQPWIGLYDSTFADLFPGHPYHSMILAMTGNKVGDPIRDFTLPDVKGVPRTLSDLTAGKMAVVDFWASWCGSCRIRSKALIPVYEKYAGDDFAVVGVALEYKNDAAWRKALAKDGYPWINLVAIDAAPSLMANHAKVFVLDRDGTILAIDPTVEDLDALLQDKVATRPRNP